MILWFISSYGYDKGYWLVTSVNINIINIHKLCTLLTFLGRISPELLVNIQFAPRSKHSVSLAEFTTFKAVHRYNHYV
jgi:hypothetical protein